MASFLGGFAKGFMDTYSQGNEDRIKNDQAIERDRDRIITEGIVRNAIEMQKNLPKALADTRKTFERYQTVLQFTGGRQDVAEAIAKDHDIKLNDLPKMRELMDAYKDMPGGADYKSTIPSDTQAEYEKHIGGAQTAFSQANKLLAGSRLLKDKVPPFMAPELKPESFTVKALPNVTIPKPDPTMKIQSWIAEHPANFASAEAAARQVNAVRQMAGYPPLELNKAASMFDGVTFGKPYETERMQQALRLAGIEGHTGQAQQQRALEIVLNTAPKELTNGGPAHLAMQKEISNRTMQIAGATQVPDPFGPPGSFTFKFAKPEQQALAALTDTDAQNALATDLALGNRAQPVMAYVYAAAVKNRLIDPAKAQNPVTPLKDDTPPRPQMPAPTPAPQQQQRMPNGPQQQPAQVAPQATQAPPEGTQMPKEGSEAVAQPGNKMGLPPGSKIKVINGKWEVVSKPKAQ